MRSSDDGIFQATSHNAAANERVTEQTRRLAEQNELLEEAVRKRTAAPAACG